MEEPHAPSTRRRRTDCRSAGRASRIPCRPVYLAGGRVVRRNVRVGTDRYGVRYVEAPDDVDVFFGAGWSHAAHDTREVLAQYLVARGELASLIGPDGVARDRQALRCGWPEWARTDHHTADG